MCEETDFKTGRIKKVKPRNFESTQNFRKNTIIKFKNSIDKFKKN